MGRMRVQTKVVVLRTPWGFRAGKEPTHIERFEAAVKNAGIQCYVQLGIDEEAARLAQTDQISDAYDKALQKFLFLYGSETTNESRTFEKLTEQLELFLQHMARAHNHPLFGPLIRRAHELKELHENAYQTWSEDPQFKEAADSCLDFFRKTHSTVYNNKAAASLQAQLRDFMAVLSAPSNRERLAALMLWETLENIMIARMHLDCDIASEMREFMKNMRIRSEELARSKEWDKMTVLRQLCFGRTHANAELIGRSRFEMRLSDLREITKRVLECPYILTLEPTVLDEILGIARMVKGPTVAARIAQSPMFIDEVSSGILGETVLLLNRLQPWMVKLTERMNVYETYETGHVLASEEGCKLAERFRGNQNAQKILIQYLQEAGSEWERTHMFHKGYILRVLTLGNENALVALAGFRAMRDSRRFEEACRMLNLGGDEAGKIRAAIKANDADAIASFVQRREALELEQKNRGIATLAYEEHPEFEGEDLLEIAKAYNRLESNGKLDQRFIAFGRNAQDVARVINAVPDELVAELASTRVLRLLKRAILSGEVKRLAQRLCDTRVSDLETAIREHEFEAKMREQTGRIVLIAGDQTRNSLAWRLGNATERQIFVVGPDEKRKKYYRNLLREGDTVIIQTSHISHANAGAAVLVCIERGIPFMYISHSNASLVLDRFGVFTSQAKDV